MRHIIYMFFLCLMAGAMFGQSKKDTKKDTTRSLDPVADMYKAATKLMDSLQYKPAIKLYEKVVKKRKDYAEAYNKMASCYLQLKDYNKAQENMELSLKF